MTHDSLLPLKFVNLTKLVVFEKQSCFVDTVKSHHVYKTVIQIYIEVVQVKTTAKRLMYNVKADAKNYYKDWVNLPTCILQV